MINQHQQRFMYLPYIIMCSLQVQTLLHGVVAPFQRVPQLHAAKSELLTILWSENLTISTQSHKSCCLWTSALPTMDPHCFLFIPFSLKFKLLILFTIRNAVYLVTLYSSTVYIFNSLFYKSGVRS